MLSGLVTLLFTDLLWRTGWSSSSGLLLGLFAVLYLLAAIGFAHGVFGFIVRLCGDKRRITRFSQFESLDIKGASTTIVVPIYNEDVARVYEGLRAIYLSLEKTGQLESFDFFILSDSTDFDKWVEEERRWVDLVRELDALGRIYYRHRFKNEGKKSGNIRDFLNNWGPPLPLFYCLGCRQHYVRVEHREIGPTHGSQSHGRVDPDHARPSQRTVPLRADAAIRQPPLRADIHFGPQLLVPKLRQLLGATTRSFAPNRSCAAATCHSFRAASPLADRYSATILSKPL